MIELSLHPTKFISKPIGKEAGFISYQLPKYKCTIDEAIFKSALENGQTWSALFAEKRDIHNWLGQQLFAADIDNNAELQSLEQIVYICERECIEPFIIHESFSSKPEARKWRVIFRTEELVQDIGEALGIQRCLADLFGGDSAVCDVARLYYGTNKPITYFDKDAILDVAELGELNKTLVTQSNKGYDLDDANKHDIETAQREILDKLAKYNQGRFDLICTVIQEQKKSVQELGKGSGYESVFSACVKLARFSELYEPIIKITIEGWIADCDTYNSWRHMHKLDDIIEKGIKFGRKNLYV